MKIEMLYPEVANLHGDNFNITYLSQCCPGSQVIRTALNETPAFVASDLDLIYLGPMSEESQRWVIDRLTPHKERIAELIDCGTFFLFTHNALEVLGERVSNPAQGYDQPGLGLLPLTTRVDLAHRYNGKVMGLPSVPLGGGVPIVGYKSQFSMVEETGEVPGFLTAQSGIGRNRHTRVEGVRVNNFIGTSLLGPLLIMNPLFTKELLRQLDPSREPQLVYEDLAMKAYRARVEDFHNPERWHDAEKLLPPGI